LFFPLETKKTTFFVEILKIQGGPSFLAPPSNTHDPNLNPSPNPNAITNLTPKSNPKIFTPVSNL